MAERDPILRALGIALRDARKRQRLSQEALSLSTGIHRNYLGGVERGEREPTVSAVAKLARGLDCSLSELFVSAEALMDANSSN